MQPLVPVLVGFLLLSGHPAQETGSSAIESVEMTTPGEGRSSRCRSNRPTEIHAFTVEADWEKRVFTNKEIAVITLTVTRPAPEDPLQLGLPTDTPISVPVEGATAWTTVVAGRYPYPFDYGETDSDGKATIKVPLKLLKEPGPYDVTHNAEIWTNQGGCPDIHEWGHLLESPGLTIRD